MSLPEPAAPRATILVPAFNEEVVIARCLSRLAGSASSGEFQIVVICNGCEDGTADAARRALPCAEVIETPVPGKSAALNIGHAVARAPVRIYLDADLVVDAADLLALVGPIEQGHAIAACGRMKIDKTDSTGPVRAFYNVWALNPYHSNGKFGGLFALSASVADRLHPLPEVTADDEFIRRSLDAEEIAVVDECAFTVRAPRTLRDLVRIRRRSLRGAGELDRLGLRAPTATGALSGVSTLPRVASRPALWFPAIFYFAISIAVRLALALERPGCSPRWERDESSRRIA